MIIKIEGLLPSVNHIYGRGEYGVYMNKDGKDFKQKLSLLAKQQKAVLIDGYVKLKFEWHCLKKGRGDLDNKLKVIQDGLNGVAYNDDKQIIAIEAYKIMNSSFEGAIIEVIPYSLNV